MRWWMVVPFLFAQERSREVVWNDRAVEIAVPVASDGKHASTVVTFPEESLEALVAGWNEEDVSLERRRDRLFIKLLKRAEGDLHVVGASGTLYRLYVRPAEGVYDGHVRIVRPESPRGRPGAVDLIRAMRTGRTPEGVAVRRASGVVWRNERASLSPLYVYDSDSHRGYVLQLENLAAQPVRLDLSKFTGDGLELVGAREPSLEAGRSTKLYLVFAR